MPRPKRSRVTATRPTKARSPPKHPQSSATPPAATQLAATLPELPSSDIYDVSDREKERVKRRAAEAAAAKASASQPRPTRASQHLDLNPEQTQALEESRRRRDEAMDRLDHLTSTSGPDRADSPAIEHSRRESATGRPLRLADASGLDLDDDIFGDLDDSLDDKNVTEATRTGYRSADTSSFNVAMFKRRPRQSSVAGRDDAPIRPTSRGQNTPGISTTLNFGNFKRRAREPSILATARKSRAQRSQSQTSQASRNASVLGDGSDSGPDGESTPLDGTRRKTSTPLAAQSSREASPALPSRKRKSLESHKDGREKRSAPETAAGEEEEIHQSIEVESNPPLTPPRGRVRERERFSTPGHGDDPHMAPPLSSPSEGSSPVAWPPLDALAHRTYARKPGPRAQTPEPADAASDISSPPSLTHSPNLAPAKTKAAARKKARAPQKEVTTADLTSLLPRRRHKATHCNSESNDPFDLDGSDDDRYDDSAAGNDGDEPSYSGPRAARKSRATQQPLSRSAPNRKGKDTKSGTKSGKGRKVRTYGSLSENKENDEAGGGIVVRDGTEEAEEEETSQVMSEGVGEELQQAAKFFKEVDKWELSFEEVTGSSSPGPDAR